MAGNLLSNNVVVLTGNGDGTFVVDRFYPAGREASALVAGDLDGDGDLDLAVTNNPRFANFADPKSGVSILLNLQVP